MKNVIMKGQTVRVAAFFSLGLACCLFASGDAAGRGFGGFRAGGGASWGGERSYGGGERGFSGYSGGERSYSYGGERGYANNGGDRYADYGTRDYSGSRSYDSYSGARGSAWGDTYNRSWTGERGTTVNTYGTRGAVDTRWGAAVGGTRDTTIDGANGRTYSGSSDRGVAVGPYGRTVGGAERSFDANGYRGSVSGTSTSGFAGNRYTGDFGLSHYSTFDAAGAAHSTAFWSHDYVTSHAGYVRTNFGYYNAFRPAWYTAHPGCWYAAGWATGAVAWVGVPWATVSNFCDMPSYPADFDYGNTIVYNNNQVYIDGQQGVSAPEFAQQASTLAVAGQQADAPTDQDWKPLGVFALVQGDEKTSNNIFQIAVNKAGILRGNFYDGLTDTTTPIYGSVDKKTQRAAWTIGKKNDRVFEAGIYNLTQGDAPILVHIGNDKTVQMLLVRVNQQASSGQ